MVWLDGVRDLTADWHFHHKVRAGALLCNIHTLEVSQAASQLRPSCSWKLVDECQKPIIFHPRHPVPVLSLSLGIHRAELPRPQRTRRDRLGARVNLKVYRKVYLHIALSLTMADRVAAPENPWSAAMDEDGSPWDGKQPIMAQTRASNPVHMQLTARD